MMLKLYKWLFLKIKSRLPKEWLLIQIDSEFVIIREQIVCSLPLTEINNPLIKDYSDIVDEKMFYKIKEFINHPEPSIRDGYVTFYADVQLRKRNDNENRYF